LTIVNRAPEHIYAFVECAVIRHQLLYSIEGRNAMTKLVTICAGLFAVLSCTPAFAEIVYDDLTTPVSASGVNQGYSSANEFGDQITLSGTGRQVNDFKFSYFLKVNSGVSTGLEIARIRFYSNNGQQVSASSFAPGTLLWDTGDFSLPVTDSLVWDKPVPNITVPSSFTWTVLFGNILPNESAGLSQYDPPTSRFEFQRLLGKDQRVVAAAEQC
jgi:hypothetical protein